MDDKFANGYTTVHCLCGNICYYTIEEIRQNKHHEDFDFYEDAQCLPYCKGKRLCLNLRIRDMHPDWKIPGINYEKLNQKRKE